MGHQVCGAGERESSVREMGGVKGLRCRDLGKRGSEREREKEERKAGERARRREGGRGKPERSAFLARDV